MPSWIRRLRARLKYRHFDRDLAEELASHRAMAESQLAQHGAAPSNAARRAALDLGNVTLAREDARAMWIPTLLQQGLQDARYALRALRRQPGFSAAAVGMLTLGLGLVSGGYTVINGMFLRGWALPDSAQVFRAGARRTVPPAAGQVFDGFSPGALKHLHARAKTADYVGMMLENFRVGAERGKLVYLSGVAVSDNFIDVLRIPMSLGTSFNGANNAGEPAIVIANTVWRRQFGADPGIVGRAVWVNDKPARVVGVTAPGYEALAERELDVIVTIAGAAALGRRSPADFIKNEMECCLLMAGRIRPAWSREQVREELQLLTSQYRRSTQKPELTVSLGDTTPGAGLSGDKRSSLVTALALIGAGVALVLLLTCANVGNLYLARSLRRQREIAVRLSLGASRPRVVRQLVTEGLVLAAIAGAGAYGVTTGVPHLLYLLEDDVTSAMFASDWRVAAFTAIGVVVTCLLVSLAPALQTTRIAWRGATATMSARTGRLRGVVLAAQIAIAAVLVLSATLLTRGMGQAMLGPNDFALHSTAIATLTWPADPGFNATAVRDRVVEAVAGSPLRAGVTTLNRPGGRLGIGNSSLTLAGVEAEFRTQLTPLSRGAWDILGLSLASGRWHADDPTRGEAVINEMLARQMFPGGNAIGQSVKLYFNGRPYAIVGIARNSHLTGLGDVEPLIHISALGSAGVTAFVLPAGGAAEAQLQSIVASVHPRVGVLSTPLSESMRQSLQLSMLGAGIAGSLGLIALGLAIVGVFGVFSYLVEERRREIGIRLALGASRRQIRASLFRASRGAIVGGLIAGLVLSAMAGATLRAQLFGVSPADPLSYAFVVLVLGAAALLATFIPIRRALATDPALTLRAE